MFCYKCGAELPDGTQVCPTCGTVFENKTIVSQTVLNQELPEEKIRNFGIWKLVSGILSMIIFAFMMFQSCAVGAVNSINKSDDTSGSAGLIVAILILVAGITSLAGRKSRGANIAIVIIALLGAVFGYSGGTYTDLPYWTTWLVIMGVLALLAFIFYKPKKKAKR